MLNKLKNVTRDALPARCQVPVKYWYGAARGDIEPEMALLAFLVHRGDHVLDVGGNRGTYAYRFWKLGARLDVFEPNPDCAGVLKNWAAGKPAVNVHAVALSSRSGTAQLHVPIDEHGVEHDASASIEHGAGGASHDFDVPLRALDSFDFTDVRLIKIDVEGHEGSVIEGAKATLTASMPALIIEIEQRHISRPIREMLADVEQLGYAGYFLIDGRLRLLREFDVAKHQSIETFEANGNDYYNNFIFLGVEHLRAGRYKALRKRWMPGPAA